MPSSPATGVTWLEPHANAYLGAIGSEATISEAGCAATEAGLAPIASSAGDRRRFCLCYLLKLPFVKEIDSENPVFIAGGHGRKARVNDPFHSNQLRVGERHVLRVGESDFPADLLL